MQRLPVPTSIAEDKIKALLLQTFQNEHFATWVKRSFPNFDFDTAFIRYRVSTPTEFKYCDTIAEVFKHTQDEFQAMLFKPLKEGSKVGFHAHQAIVCTISLSPAYLGIYTEGCVSGLQKVRYSTGTVVKRSENCI